MNQPVKLGWGLDALYLEVHPPLEEDDRPVEVQIAETFDEITLKLAARPDLALDEAAVKLAILEKSGLPVPIARASQSSHAFENRYQAAPH
jgi:L,D-transpeptidase ErfK/SrfK